MRMLDIDRCIAEFDIGLRTLFGVHPVGRPSPGDDVPEADLRETVRRHAAALMRVNHCGEVCAQALYQGQSLASDNPALRNALGQAAREEADHLAWCEGRIAELGGRVSVLNPLWYAGSLAIGYVAGRLGDEWSLGFLAETEHQVEHHLEGHLARLSETDARTRAVVEAMKHDEAGHADTARRLGARELPAPVKGAMELTARVMTTASYWI
jgi:ubiquinone biosynthesis monooxygenase Coq7